MKIFTQSLIDKLIPCLEDFMMLFPSKVKLLVVHCSDTDNNQNLNSADIHKMHLGFGWDGIGYHKVILRSGEIENGRPEYWVGAHVKGENDVSLGFALLDVMNLQMNNFLLLKKFLKFGNQNILKQNIGHSNIENTDKTCPNFDVITWANKFNL